MSTFRVDIMLPWVLLSSLASSWLLTGLQHHAHEFSSLIMIAYEHSIVLISILSTITPCSCVYMTPHGHLRVLESNYEQPWALMSLLPCCQKSHEHPRALLSMAPGALKSSHTIKAPCPSLLFLLRSAHGRTLLPLSVQVLDSVINEQS